MSSSPAEQQARASFRAWEEVASRSCASFVRDPRTLEIGGALLSATLGWKRTLDDAAHRAWTGWVTLVSSAA